MAGSRSQADLGQTCQCKCQPEVHVLGGLAFYLVYAEALARVFVARMPFPVEEVQRFNQMVEMVKDENGWWDWLEALG